MHNGWIGFWSRTLYPPNLLNFDKSHLLPIVVGQPVWHWLFVLPEMMSWWITGPPIILSPLFPVLVPRTILSSLFLFGYGNPPSPARETSSFGCISLLQCPPCEATHVNLRMLKKFTRLIHRLTKFNSGITHPQYRCLIHP